MHKFAPLIFVVVALVSCGQKKDVEYSPEYASVPLVVGDKEFIIGVHPMHNPKMLHDVFGPIADYLTKNIEGVTFKIEGSRNFSAYIKKLSQRRFHFALPNPYQTVSAFEHGYKVFAKMADDENFRGVFIVRKDSNIKNPIDLKGHAVSFPDPGALAATMMPQFYLQKHGLNVMQDIDIKYVGSQESSIMNVMMGNTKAGTSWLPAWRALSKKRPELAKNLMVVWKTPSLPNNSLIVRDDIDIEMVNKVKRLIMNYHQRPKKHSTHMHSNKFEAANNETYEPVVEFLKRFNKEVRPIY